MNKLEFQYKFKCIFTIGYDKCTLMSCPLSYNDLYCPESKQYSYITWTSYLKNKNYIQNYMIMIGDNIEEILHEDV